MINYVEFVEDTKDNEVKYVHYDPMFKQYSHLALSTSFHPFSVKQIEANYIYDFIIKHKLTRGFEIATGTGASAAAAGLAFKETNGLLVTMDAVSYTHLTLPTIYSV